MKVMQINSSGSEVTDLQRRLKLLGYDMGTTGVDGIFRTRTENAVKKFQQDRGLRASGVVDQETWQELVDAGYKIGDRLLYLKNPPFRGDDVKTLQLWLKTLGFYPDNENGIFCQKTHRALLDFQENMNIDDDGILGEQSLRHLKGLQRIITERKTSNFPFIKQKKESREGNTIDVVFDFDPSTPGEEGSVYVGSRKAYSQRTGICLGIIRSCMKIIEKNGFSTRLSFSGDRADGVTVFDRIFAANTYSGGLLVSIGLNHSVDKGANGCSCYYFKGLKSYSIGGSQLAESIQDCLVRNLGLLDCRVHGANYAILKNTEMISVVVEPAFISNEKQKKQIMETGYQNKIGESISEAIISFLEDH